jgi:hypothetical protein
MRQTLVRQKLAEEFPVPSDSKTMRLGMTPPIGGGDLPVGIHHHVAASFRLSNLQTIRVPQVIRSQVATELSAHALLPWSSPP